MRDSFISNSLTERSRSRSRTRVARSSSSAASHLRRHKPSSEASRREINQIFFVYYYFIFTPLYEP
jgi:hypothetical protein